MTDLTVLLLRFSDEDQIGGMSFEFQERLNRDCDAANPYPDGLPRQLVVLKDEAVSGTFVLERRAVKDALALARDGRLARLIVWKYDRLGRDEAEVFVALKEFESLGVEVLSATEAKDKFVRAILVVAAAYESRKIGVRSKEGLRQLALEGFPSGPPPVGLRAVQIPDPRGRRDHKGEAKLRSRWVRDPDLADVVILIIELAADSWSDKEIAHHLNRINKPSPTARGQGWDSSTVRAVRMRPTYKGTLVHGRTSFVRTKRGTRVPRENPAKEWIVIPDCPNIERLVSDELWDRAQQRDEEAKRVGRQGGRGANPRYPLAGLIKCDHCGGKMIVSPSTKRGVRSLRLRCGWHIRRGDATCPNARCFNYETVFDAILDVLHRDLFDQRNVDTLINLVTSEVKKLTSGSDQMRSRAEADLRKAEGRLKNILDIIERQQVQLEGLVLRAKECERQVAESRARIASSQAPAPISPERIEAKVKSSVGRMKEVLQSGTVPEVQAELRRHLPSITINEDGRLRLEGSLSGLLQGETAVVRNSNSGGGI